MNGRVQKADILSRYSIKWMAVVDLLSRYTALEKVWTLHLFLSFLITLRRNILSKEQKGSTCSGLFNLTIQFLIQNVPSQRFWTGIFLYFGCCLKVMTVHYCSIFPTICMVFFPLQAMKAWPQDNKPCKSMAYIYFFILCPSLTVA